jgi:prepilin-type N-terminal cleavage/methylation domain-containing protein
MGREVKRGYTLIEVAVVLLVLALTAGVIVPAAGRVADTVRIRAQVSGVAAFLRLAREQAVTRQRAFTVQLDPDAHALVLSQAGDGGADSVRATRSLAPDVQVEGDQPAGRRITFYPHGLSSGGRLRIEAPGPRVYMVTVDVLTGRVRTEREGS